jgi:hypothetical protein
MRHRSTAIRDRFRRQAAARKANCYLCGKPIDYTLRWPDPMCFVADHVRALKPGKGQTPGTDTPDNLAASHNTCNSTKRARLVAPIVRRSGSLN